MRCNRRSADEQRVSDRTRRRGAVCEDEMTLNALDNPTFLSGLRSLHPQTFQLARLPQTRLRRTETIWPDGLYAPPIPPFKRCRLTSTPEKRYDPNDPTLRFVDRDDQLDFLYEGFTSRRALMSCGHAVTPSSLTNWCLKLLDEGESRFVCGQTGCNAEWPYEEVCKMALLTPEEKKLFEKAMSTNAARANTKPCPECKSPVVRTDESDLRVGCPVCPVTRGRSHDFCWQCLRPWKGPAPRSDHCGNDGCCNESLKTLQTCPEILLEHVPCPSIRACPTCGILLQRDSKGCKNVYCPRCNKPFCFVCLGVTGYHQCSSVAPRQTSVPVWQKK